MMRRCGGWGAWLRAMVARMLSRHGGLTYGIVRHKEGQLIPFDGGDAVAAQGYTSIGTWTEGDIESAAGLFGPVDYCLVWECDHIAGSNRFPAEIQEVVVVLNCFQFLAAGV